MQHADDDQRRKANLSFGRGRVESDESGVDADLLRGFEFVPDVDVGVFPIADLNDGEAGLEIILLLAQFLCHQTTFLANVPTRELVRFTSPRTALFLRLLGDLFAIDELRRNRRHV